MGKRIIVAPLDWGLGHATRCVPIVAALQEGGHDVVLVAGGRPFDFLSARFPGIEIIRCEGYGVTYPKDGNMLTYLLRKSFSFYKSLEHEYKEAGRIAEETKADIIISDNRLNFHSRKTKNIYITHQLTVKAGIATPAATALHRRYYSQFDEVWVPDNEGQSNLSGELGHNKENKIPVHYIGPLTRFSLCENHVVPDSGRILFILSGPEPQRTIFEEIILHELKANPRPAIVLRGIPGEISLTEPIPGVKMYNHLHDDQFLEAILAADIIVSRPGYSTLCDLSAYGKKIVAVPTPGQPEQEYLASYHAGKQVMQVMQQDAFSLGKALEKSEQTKPLHIIAEQYLSTVLSRL